MEENKGVMEKRARIVTDATSHAQENERTPKPNGASPTAVNVDADRFDRQKRVEKWDQGAIEKQNVLVVGAGALGNEVCKLLFQLGVGRVHVVDFDTVIEANLNRCVFFSPTDVQAHAFKADVIARKAQTDYPHTRVTADTRNVDQLEESVFQESTAVFGCLDNLGARLHVNAHAYGHCPMFDGGTTGFLGKVQVVQKPSACLECGMSKSDYKLLWKRYSCVGEVLDLVDPKTPAIATTTSIIAGMQVNEWLKYVFDKQAETQGATAGKYLHYDGFTQQMQVFDVPKREKCPVHG